MKNAYRISLAVLLLCFALLLGVGFKSKNKPVPTPTSKPAKTPPPIVCIVFDDIKDEQDLKAIETLKIKFTPSFFPKSKFSSKTPILAKNIKII